MKKIDIIKVVGLTGTLLGVVSTIISGWSQQKDMERTIEEKVAKSLNGEVNEES